LTYWKFPNDETYLGHVFRIQIPRPTLTGQIGTGGAQVPTSHVSITVSGSHTDSMTSSMESCVTTEPREATGWRQSPKVGSHRARGIKSQVDHTALYLC
jgi:hypothetical protein